MHYPILEPLSHEEGENLHADRDSVNENPAREPVERKIEDAVILPPFNHSEVVLKLLRGIAGQENGFHSVSFGCDL